LLKLGGKGPGKSGKKAPDVRKRYAESEAEESGSDASSDEDEESSAEESGSDSGSEGKRGGAGKSGRRRFIVEAPSSGEEDSSSGASSSEEEESGEGSGSESGSDAGGAARKPAAPRRRLRKLHRAGGAAAVDEEDLALIAEAAERGDVDARLAAAPLAKRMRTNASESAAGVGSGEGDASAAGAGEGSAAGVGGGLGAADDDEYDSEGLDEFIERDRQPAEGGAGGAGRKRKAREMYGYGGAGGVDAVAASDFDAIFGAGTRAAFFRQREAAGMVDGGGRGGAEERAAAAAASAAAKGGLAGLYSDDEDEEAPAAAADAEAEAAEERGGAGAGASSASQQLASREAVLRSAYEPAVLAANLIARSDIDIRERDVPERLQTCLRARRERRERIAKAAAAAGAGVTAGSGAAEATTAAGAPLAAAVAADRAMSFAGEAGWIAERLLVDPAVGVLSPDHDLPPASPSLYGVTVPSAESGAPTQLRPAEVAVAVEWVLRALYEEQWDVPFIWGYRRDHLLPSMGLGHLWAIADADEAWTRMAARKVAVAASLDRARTAGAADDALCARVQDDLAAAATERQVEDVAAALQLGVVACAGQRGIEYDHSLLAASAAAAAPSAASSGAGSAGPSFGPIPRKAAAKAPQPRDEIEELFGLGDEEEEEEQGALSAGMAALSASNSASAAAARGRAAPAGVASRHDLYRVAHAAGVGRLVAAVFLPAHQLAVNLRSRAAVHAVPEGQPDQGRSLAAGLPREAVAEALRALAFECLSEDFTGEAKVLSAASHIAAVDIAREPFLRAWARRQLFERAQLSTDPTEKGRGELDASHPLFGLQRLRRKHLHEFTGVRVAKPVTSYVEPAAPAPAGSAADAGSSLAGLAAARVSEGMLRLTQADDPLQGVADDEHPSLAWETAPSPGADVLGLQSGWGSHLAGARLYRDPVRGTIARLEARAGGYTQFAAIARAEAQGLLTVSVTVDPRAVEELAAVLGTFYLTPSGVANLGGTRITDPAAAGLLSAADEQRRGALVAAIGRLLLPEAVAEVRAQLTRVAHEALAGEYAQGMRRRLMMAPLQPPPQPLRKRRGGAGGKGGDDDEEDGAAGAAAASSGAGAGSAAAASEPPSEMPLVRYPWQRVRARVLSIALPRAGIDAGAQAGKAGPAAGLAVLLDGRGDVTDFVVLPPRHEEREAALAEFLFAQAPDVVVVGSGGGVRVRDIMSRTLAAAALRCDALVRTARAHYKRRKQLLKRHGPGLDSHADANVRGQWQEAAFVDELKHLQPLAERWTTGRWKFWRPRLPAMREDVDRQTGQRVQVPDGDAAAQARASLQVHALEDEVARVFATSGRGRGEFPDYSPLLRYAVSLGRYAQDPVSEVAYVWAKRADESLPGVRAALASGVTACPADLLSIRFHGLQGEAPQRLLYAAAERVMVEVVNGVGVELNLAASRPHLNGTLQFVAGLGPRKAAAALVALQRLGNRTPSRAALLERRVLSEQVYANAAGFLRVLPSTAGLSAGKGGAGEALANAYGADDAVATLRARRSAASKHRSHAGRVAASASEEGGAGARRAGDLAYDYAAFNPLDATRIHPSAYELAVQMCRESDQPDLAAMPGRYDELSLQEPGSYADLVLDVSTVAQEALAGLLRERSIAWHAWWPSYRDASGAEVEAPGDLLKDLDLAAFAENLAAQGLGPMLRTLEGIKAELRAPFRDARRPYERPSPDALFRLLTHESCFSLRPGLRVPVRVVHVGGRRVGVRLDDGLRGDIWDNQTGLDTRNGDALSSHFAPDTIITARITEVRRAEFSVLLSTLPFVALEQNLVDTGYGAARGAAVVEMVPEALLLALSLNPPPVVDDACDVSACLRDQLDVAVATAAAAKLAALESGASAAMLAAAGSSAGPGGLGGKGAGGVVLRAIAHPHFQNVLKEDALRFLADRPLFDCLFRPSSLGTDHLTISWKIAEPDVVVHLDVEEADKEGLPPTALGRRLLLDGKAAAYGDLDEVLARHIEPMAAQHAALRNARIFRDATQEVVDEEIRAQLRETPQRIPYLVSPNPRAPGSYVISFMIKSAVHHETVSVTPQGLKWRGVVSPNWHKLVEDFKARCRTRPQPPKPAGGAVGGAGPSPAGAAASGAPRGNRWDSMQPSASAAAAAGAAGYAPMRPSSYGGSAADAAAAASGYYGAPAAAAAGHYGAAYPAAGGPAGPYGAAQPMPYYHQLPPGAVPVHAYPGAGMPAGAAPAAAAAASGGRWDRYASGAPAAPPLPQQPPVPMAYAVQPPGAGAPAGYWAAAAGGLQPPQPFYGAPGAGVPPPQQQQRWDRPYG